MGKLDGKVAFITGAARGQGRSHAVKLASEGADIIAIDSCADTKTALYPMATEEDLAETVSLVEALDRRIVATKADVRDRDHLKKVVAAGVAELGRLDIVSANARSIIITSSTAGRKGLPFFAPYVAAKTGVVGVAKSLANELGERNIRVNTVHPTGVNTKMLDGLGGMSAIIEHHPKVGPLYENALPVELVEPEDISNAVLWLASDDAKYVTGVELSVDAGVTIR
jgi:NAD(P)-dependent dehydrogenase (short-subunit alcohol dehydrogenase family)